MPPPPALPGLSEVAVVELRTADGLALLGWHVAPTRQGAPTILSLAGNGGSLAHRAPRVQRFRQHGFGALFVAWRGYGGNAGTPGEDGFTRDAEAGLAFLRACGAALVGIARLALLGVVPAYATAPDRPVLEGAAFFRKDLR